jgi:glycosyltransferase involved in cell wall biosynthesis
MTKLCLSMIVKNERANLARCFSSIADHVDYWVIGDTGSTDGTQDYIRGFFAERGLRGELHSFPFVNFEQARNEALRRAYGSELPFDYLLLTDADMELVVEDGGFRARLEEPGYQLMQRAVSGLVYWNIRMVHRDVGAWYHGVTHEYLDVPGGATRLAGLWYKDYACGANRADKFERDIRLLTEALEQEPDNSRHFFYLAQSYRDAGRKREAAEAYAQRVAMGGWDEEVWTARREQARCLRDLGDEGGFLTQALAAFNQRPHRAEPLYDLARYYRVKGWNAAATLFSERGLEIPIPKDDVLFVEEWAYRYGLQEEFSIAANYAGEAERKDRGFAACEGLAFNRDIPAGPRELAFSNLQYYAQPLNRLVSSFVARRLEFSPPEGFKPLNPAVERRGGDVFVFQRTINYKMSEDGLRYVTEDGAPVQMRCFLLRLDEALRMRSCEEILLPEDLSERLSGVSLLLEDLRLFCWREGLWVSAIAREPRPERMGKHILARIEDDETGSRRLVDWRVVEPQAPKDSPPNAMPQVLGETLRFIYTCDPVRILDETGRLVAETVPAIFADSFKGGAQAIAFDDGWLAIVQEMHFKPVEFYRHRFIWFDATNALRAVSRPFYFDKKTTERAVGLTWSPCGERLVISYGVSGLESWLATVDADEVRDLLQPVDLLLSGALEKGGAAPAGSSQEARSSKPKPRAAAQQLAAPPRDESIDIGPFGASTSEAFSNLFPFLRDADSVVDRRRLSQDFDARIIPHLSLDDVSRLPQIHCFYEPLAQSANHQSLVAATASMAAAGHAVKVWSYSPRKLEFLRGQGVQVAAADEVVPQALFERVLARSEIRYFSDIFRYAVLYEHGGLWMDTDVVLLRPFPFRGAYFFNLQWRAGAAGEHFICGNVIYAKPFSPHIRRLYERAIALFFDKTEGKFGDVGPKLLSDYVASDEGAELRKWVFSPMFFNSIDWTETHRFDRPVGEAALYLNDERVFGVHLWNAKTNQQSREGESLISRLSDPIRGFAPLANLAEHYDTDRNRHTGNRHGYARVFGRLLSSRRFSLQRLLEIGLCRGLSERGRMDASPIGLWQTYFPFGHIIGVDPGDFSRFNDHRFTSFACDPSQEQDLRALAEKLGPSSLDVVIDDGTHASFDQQLALRELFPLLREGGWYFIQALDWQPPGEDEERIARTKSLLFEIEEQGRARSLDPLGVSALADEMQEILFFDSHYELPRANLLGGLVAIRKRGGSGLV